MSRRAFNPTAKQRRWVEAMIGYGIPEAGICRLIEDPHTGEPIDLETLREHFAKEIATGAVKANLQVANFLLATILGREGGVRDHQSRVRAAIFFAKTRMGWTAAKGHERVGEPIVQTARYRDLKMKSPGSREVSRWKKLADHQWTERDRSSFCIRGQGIGASFNVVESPMSMIARGSATYHH